TNTRIDRVTVRNTNRAFRIWKDLQGGTLTAENFAGGAIWAGRDARVHVRKLIARTQMPGIVFRLESGASVTVDTCDLSGVAPGSTLLKADGADTSVKLGPSCKLP
ncbi:hypothetical protein ACFPQ7_19120, partial [Methylobacterium iners]|uniref:hypothetical protein n=1 Tax=Methylobacterium iners TaxID=418707 RepID=UPI00360D8CE0